MKRCVFALVATTALTLLAATAASSAGLVMPKPWEAKSVRVQSQPIRFVAPVHYAVGKAPSAVAVGQFDGQMKPDLVVANEGSNTISLLHGDGRGHLVEPTTVAVGLSPVGIAVFDANQDNHADLAVANNRSSTVTVLRGLPKSGFQRQTTLRTGRGPRSITVESIYPPLDDEYMTEPLTIATTNEDSNTVSLFTANAAGNFTREDRRSPLAVGRRPADVFMQRAMTTPDEYGDVYVANRGSTRISLIKHTRTGFARQTTVRVGSGPTCFLQAALAAVNQYTEEDPVALFVANANSDNISVFRINEETDRLTREPTVTAGDGPVSIAMDDFDGDGNGDLAVVNRNGGTIWILCGDGRGHFRRTRTIGGLSSPSCIVAADFNGDARPDLAVTEAGADRVSVLLNETRYVTMSAYVEPGRTVGYRQRFSLMSVVVVGSGYGFHGESDMWRVLLRNRNDIQAWKKSAFDGQFTLFGTATPNKEYDGFFYETSTAAIANTDFIAYFPGDQRYCPSMSDDAQIRVRALLVRPSMPAVVRRGRAFLVRGQLLPLHPLDMSDLSDLDATRLYFFRRIRGHYRIYRRVDVWGMDIGETRYYRRYRLPTRGRWYVKAYHADSSHAPTWSAARRFVVR